MTRTPKILKGIAPVAGRRIEAAVWDADRRVREMVASADAEADRILAEAEAARERVLAAAREAGRREGLAEAAATVARAALERDRILRHAQGEVVRLGLAVARKVLGRELAAGTGAVTDVAAAALAEARDRRQVVLRVSPRDAAAIREAHGRLAAALSRAPLELREDPAVAPGGAVVDSEAGRIDATLDAQLDVIARAIDEELA